MMKFVLYNCIPKLFILHLYEVHWGWVQTPRIPTAYAAVTSHSPGPRTDCSRAVLNKNRTSTHGARRAAPHEFCLPERGP